MAVIAVDFDGTIVTHEYPRIGTELPFATETLKMLARDGHQLILWSVREGDLLQEAVDWCKERGVEFWAVNKDYPEEEKEKNEHYSRKLKAPVEREGRRPVTGSRGLVQGARRGVLGSEQGLPRGRERKERTLLAQTEG